MAGKLLNKKRFKPYILLLINTCVITGLLENPAQAQSAPRTDITQLPGTTSVVRGIGGIEAATTDLSGAGSRCPGPTEFTNVTQCSEMQSVTQPYIMRDGELTPACPGMSDRQYRQLLGINIAALRLMNQSRRMIAQRMTCLLGVTVSEAQVTNSLGSMAGLLCDSSGRTSRDFVVSCGDSGVGSTASFQGGLPYAPGQSVDTFCGTVQFRPDAISRTEDAMRNARASGQASAAEFRKLDLMDSVIHEQTHALVRSLTRTLPGADASAPPNHSCSVGTLSNSYESGCRFFDGQRDQNVQIQIGSSGTDATQYRPYRSVSSIDERRMSLERDLGRLQSRIPAIQDRLTRGRPLSSSQQRDWDMFQALTTESTRLTTERGCAVAAEASPRAISTTDFDSPTNPCGVTPSGRFRNETTARAVARDILRSRSGCESASREFFDFDRVRSF